MRAKRVFAKVLGGAVLASGASGHPILAPEEKRTLPEGKAAAMDTKRLVEEIRGANDMALGRLAQGQGSGRVRISELFLPRGEKDEEKFHAVFTFKDENTKTAEYELSDGQPGQLRWTHVDTPKLKLGYRPGANAYVAPGSRGGHTFRILGRDFHPETFYMPYQVGLADHLEGLRKSSARFEPHIRADGLLEIEVSGNLKHGLWSKLGRVLLDPGGSFRLVHYDYLSQWDEYGSTTEVHFDGDYDGQFSPEYPKRVRRKLRETYKEPGQETTEANIEVEVEILAIDLRKEVAESDFTLEALGVPPGTEVVDFLRAIRYPYGFAPEDDGRPAAQP